MTHTAHSQLEALTPDEHQLLKEYSEQSWGCYSKESWGFKIQSELPHQDFLKNPKCMVAMLHTHKSANILLIRAILKASPELIDNEEFMLAAVRIDKYAILNADILIENENFMLQAIAIDPGCINLVSPCLPNLSNFKTKAMIQTPQAAYHVYERASILAAIKSNPVVMAHLNEYILKDEEFIKQALRSNLEAIQHLHLGIKFRPSIFWNIQRSNLNSPEINRYKTQFLMLESIKALASIAMATVGVLLVASVISSPFALALGLPLIGLAVLCLGWMTKSHLEARHQSQMYARS